MLALLSALLLLASAELTTIYEHGQFTSEVGLYDPGLDASEHVMRVYFNPPRCVSAFEVRVNGGETPAIVETVVGHQDGKYLWKTIGSAVITPENRAITLEDAPHCVSRFRVTIEKGVYTGVWADTEEAPNTRKRAISCTFSATDKWPNTCKSSSAGTQCLTLATPNFCGCTEDGDCFADVSHPFCNVAGNPGPSGDGPGTCVKCTYAPGTTTVPQQGYACRLRTPSRYFADASLATKTQSPGFNLIQFSQGEQIPTESYFKEVCISGSNSGACERCDQASSTNAPDYNIAYPDYTGAKPTGDVSQDGSFQDGLRGSYFCKTVYGATSPHPQRPVCISNGVFAASGLSSIFQNYVLTMEIGHFGTGTPSDAPGAPVPTDPATTGVDTPRLVVEWEGACGPCVLQSAITGGTSIRLHTICSYTQATTPICDADPTKGCRGCATNADCGVQTASCLTDGSASCTGGKNCQANGSCKTCTLDSDCGLLDGGENKLQAKCDVASGLCVDAFSCTGNLGQLTAADCSALNGGNNCQKDGTCKTCTTNADCGTLDGGTTQNQQVCNTVTGICGSCTTNANCVGTTGANCQKDGTCVDCTTAPATVCGAADGGAPTVSTCTAGVFCADANDQSICNAGTKRCEPPCLSNAWCSGKRTAQAGVTTNNGANCGSSGICADCQTPGSPTTIPNSPNCGTVDGPPTGLTGTTGAAGQTSCDPSGICVDPFTCTTNPSCSGAPAAPFTCTDTTTSCANCQVGGSCLPCVVDYTTSTCGAGLDGGEVVSQVNCRTASRQCVAACTSSDNTGCAGTQGANCMANGVCFNCRDDSDCKTGNAWGGDFGGQTVCISTICTDPCASNTICGANSNCMKDGRCKPCTNDADCVANDGPPPMGTDIKCNSGVCIPPYTCSGASGTPADNNGCKTNTGSNNCMADGTCKTCTKDSDCIGDGGFKPNQPKCDVASGTCVECGSNADCLGTGVALNCDDDGLCRDCRTYPSGFACNTRDGPAAGLPSRNPNCDTVTGICVDFCVKDSDCTDACAPHCHIDRGCCVECTTQTHCPVTQWRGSQKGYTFCSTDWVCTLPPTPSSGGLVCETDADCSGSTPACDYGRQVCVQCLADAHCNRTSTGTRACQIGARRCVDCTDDSYCRNNLDEDGNPKTCTAANTCESGSAFVSVSLFACLLLALIRLF